MAIKRSMDLLEILGEAEIFPEAVMDRIIEEHPDLENVEWEVNVTSYSPGRSAVMHMPNGDPGYPAEPADYEIDAWPEQVAGRMVKKIVSVVDDDLLNSQTLSAMSDAIYAAEQAWQDDNLGEKVDDEMCEAEEYLW